MCYANGSESVLSPGPFAQLVAIRRCMCSDGVARYAKITGQPDTAWTVPAQVQVRGKSVSGFVSFDSSCGEDKGYTFHASKFGKNGGLLP